MGRILSNLIGRKGQTYPDTLAALRENNLAWGVTKRPLFARIPNAHDPEHGVMKRADNLYGIVRDDNGRTLGVATSRYTCVTNVEGFGPLDVLAKSGSIDIVGANELDGGQEVWIQARCPEKISIGGNDPIDYYVLAVLHHDGKGSVRYVDTPLRRFCTNQNRAIFGNKNAQVNLTLRHTASVSDKVKDARKLLERVYLNQRTFIVTAEQMLSQTFSRSEMEALAKQLLPKPDESEPTTTTRMVRNWSERFETLMRDAYGARDLDDIRFTKYGAFNAVTDFEQHYVRVKGDATQQAETLLKRAFDDGPLATRAFALLTA